MFEREKSQRIRVPEIYFISEFVRRAACNPTRPSYVRRSRDPAHTHLHALHESIVALESTPAVNGRIESARGRARAPRVASVRAGEAAAGASTGGAGARPLSAALSVAHAERSHSPCAHPRTPVHAPPRARPRQAKKEVLARLLPEECTFRPEVNRRGAAAAPDAGDGDGVPERAFDRLHKLAASRAESHDRAARELGPDFTFSPAATLTKAARKLKADASASPSSAGHGLYERALASRAALETRAKQLADAEYTFEPKITAKARRLKREGTAVDRLYDPTAIQRRNDVNHKCVLARARARAPLLLARPPLSPPARPPLTIRPSLSLAATRPPRSSRTSRPPLCRR